jgi:hypothetical protein
LTRWQGRIPVYIGVTGHRHLHVDEIPVITATVRSFLEDLKSRLPSTPIVVMSELAEGADQLVTSIALALGCESVCVLPLEVATYRAGFGAAARADFDRLLAAGEVVELPGVAAYEKKRDQGYAAAGRYIAQHATLLIALWDGVNSSRPGSTSDVMRARSSWTTGDSTLFRLLVRRAGQPPRTTQPDGSWGLSADAAIAAAGLMQTERFNAAALAAERKS